MPFELPTYRYCDRLVDRGDDLNPLESFVHDNEPAGKIDEAWRASLTAAILHAISENRS